MNPLPLPLVTNPHQADFDWESLAAYLNSAAHVRIEPRRAKALGGGGGTLNWYVPAQPQPVMMKLTGFDDIERMEAEAEGLVTLARIKTWCVPEVLCCAAYDQCSLLVMEWIEPGTTMVNNERALAEALGEFHQQRGSAFGWHRHNFLGKTPQTNTPSDDWLSFYLSARLAPQLRLAKENNLADELIVAASELLRTLTRWSGASPVAPGLVHGDLWRGNAFFDQQGRPVVIDPAVHYGDPESDIAMAELFGNFSADFYAGYRSVLPDTEQGELRRDLYKLYHLLNHANIFGGAYVQNAQRLALRLTSMII